MNDGGIETKTINKRFFVILFEVGPLRIPGETSSFMIKKLRFILLFHFNEIRYTPLCTTEMNIVQFTLFLRNTNERLRA